MRIDGKISSEAFALDQTPLVDGEAFKKQLQNATDAKDLEGLKEACQAFEAFFIQKLFTQMRKTSEMSGAVPKSSALETFEKMLDEELSKEMGKAGGFGLANAMFDNIKRAYGLDEKPEKSSTEDLLSQLSQIE